MAVNTILRVCQKCGVTFTVGRIDRGPMFCSRACRADHRHDLAAANRLHKVCERCGGAFQVKPSRAADRFCSLACIPRPGRRILPRPVRVCQYCGTPFAPKFPYKKNIFCSFGCRARGRPIRVDVDYRTTTSSDGKRHLVHRLRAEAALGRPLPSRHPVHHADGKRADDSPLVICEDLAYHRLLHQRMRVKAAGGNPNTDARCSHCIRALPFSSFYKHSRTFNGLSCICRSCTSIYQKAHPRKRKESAA